MNNKVEDSIDEIVILGTGFIGLPLALQLAANGKQVIGVDIDQNLVDAINDQSLNLDEERLQTLLESETVDRNLEARTEPSAGDAFVISVPTPLSEPQKSPDLSYIEAAIESIIPYLEVGDLIIIESTIPPLTCQELICPMLSEAGFEPGDSIQLAHAPERILPGNIFEEIVQNDRIIGGIDQASAQRAAKVYEPFLEGNIFFTDILSAELSKLMENTFRDVNVALANEFALISEELDVSSDEIIELANHHPRVDILNPGIGVGGHCLPVDPWFLNQVDPEDTNLITTSRSINEMMPKKVTSKIRQTVSEYENPTLVALGAAYKPNTYDIRNSPARVIVDSLLEDGYTVEHLDRHVDGLDYDDLKSELSSINPDAIILLVPHDETISELQSIESWLDESGIQFLDFGRGDPLTP